MVRISKAATRVYLMYSHSHSSSVSSTSWSTAYFPSSLRSQSSNVTAFFFPATPAVTIEDCCSWQVVAISVSRVIRTPSLISPLGTLTSQRETPPKPSNNTDQQERNTPLQKLCPWTSSLWSSPKTSSTGRCFHGGLSIMKLSGIRRRRKKV